MSQESRANQIESKRMEAAVASGGVTSDDTVYRAVLAAASKSNILRDHVVDFGAGRGNFSRLLVDIPQISAVSALDLCAYPDAFQHSKLRWTACDLNGVLPWPDDLHHAILAVEVIEHLENPRHVAREWFRVLKPGGSVVLSTPNNESVRSLVSLLFRGHYAGFTGQSYPAHITALLRKDLERILNEAGFVGVEFAYSNHGFPPKFFTFTWQQLSFGLLNGLRYSDNLVCVAHKPV